MKKEIIILALISTLFTGCAYAAPSVAEDDFEEMFGTIKEKVQPRPIDDKAAKLAKEFAQKNNGPDPTLAEAAQSSTPSARRCRAYSAAPCG